VKRHTCAISLKQFDYNTTNFVETPYFVNLTYFTDKADGVAQLNKIDAERGITMSEHSGAVTYRKTRQQNLIAEIYFLPHPDKKLIGFISHEVSHVILHYYKIVFEVSGLAYTDFEEQYCYTQGILVQDIYDWLKNKKIL